MFRPLNLALSHVRVSQHNLSIDNLAGYWCLWAKKEKEKEKEKRKREEEEGRTLTSQY